MSGVGALGKLGEWLRRVTSKLATGQELSTIERKAYVDYLRTEGSDPRLADSRPGLEERSIPEFDPTSLLYRGTSLSEAAPRAPTFTFLNEAEPARNYAGIYSPAEPGVVSQYLAPSAKPIRHRGMLEALLDDPSVLRRAIPEVEDILDRPIGDISGVQDYLYSPTFQKILRERGYNSMLSLEDDLSTGALHDGFIALDPSILKHTQSQYLGRPEWAAEYKKQGIGMRELSPEYLQLGQPHLVGKFWDRKKQGGLARVSR